MSDHYDVIIVGGGILGCAVAFSLGRRRGLRVLLIERTSLGAQTTSRAAALITRARDAGEDRALIAQTHKAIEILQNDYGEDIAFNKVASLHVGETVKSAEAITRSMADLQAEGVQVDWKTQEQASQQTGWLHIDQAEVIACVPDDGYVDPYILCAAYIRAAKRDGVQVIQGQEVTGLEAKQVRTATGYFTCEQVVVTTGPWMNMLMGNMPYAPVRSQYWITQAHQDIRAKGPVTILPDAKAYVRPEVAGLLFGIRDDEAVYASPKDLPADLSGFSFNEDYEGWQSLEQSIEPLQKRCPILNSLEIRHYISGPSSYTPDGRFVIGPVGPYLVAGGACGAGIAISAGVGEIIADLVCHERAAPLRYAPNRFGSINPFDATFLQQCARARSQKKAG